jgi:hypothetical protein
VDRSDYRGTRSTVQFPEHLTSPELEWTEMVVDQKPRTVRDAVGVFKGAGARRTCSAENKSQGCKTTDLRSVTCCMSISRRFPKSAPL